MSGIAGIIHFDGAPAAPEPIQGMTAAMAYRGPDGINHWIKGSVALGQCMLRTTPESLEETQPLANEDESLVLVMDGRVDNWEELRGELLGRGVVLRSRADTELVLRAYETWGKDCLAHIEGDFALVIWDAKGQTVFCARDRMGNKPLNYHWDGKTFIFASELHPILGLPWVKQEMNEGMLAEFLAWEFHSREETLWKDILRLAPANFLRLSSSGLRREQYWMPDLGSELSYRKDEDYIEHYRELFADAVRRTSRSHRAVAIEVSGGLDSTAVFCMAEHLRLDSRLLAPGIEAYTVAFDDDSGANEIAYARAAGDHLNVPVREVPPTRMPLAEYSKIATTGREFPGYPNGAMAIGLHDLAARRGSRVLFTGEWGDAFLQGSRLYYAEEFKQMRFRALYGCFKLDAETYGAMQSARWFLRYGILPLAPQAMQDVLHRLVRKIRRSETSDELYWLSPAMRKILRQRRKQHAVRQPVRNVCQRELLRMLQSPLTDHIMEQNERQTAHAGLEMRHPLGDARLVQFAFATPERLRLHGDISKYIHVKAMRGLMPDLILDRKSKAEFSSLFRGYLDGMQEIMTNPVPSADKWLTRDGMQQLYGVYRKNPQLGWPLWVLWSIYGCTTLLGDSSQLDIGIS